MPISKDNTKKFLAEVNMKTNKNLVTATLAVERDAKIIVDVDTGTLERSITHKFLSKTKAIVGSNVEYAPHLELGTSKMSARPYLRPALHQNLGFIKRLFGIK